jgi:endo-1,4-beta-mannosidase
MCRTLVLLTAWLAAACPPAAARQEPPAEKRTVLGVRGTRFTVNGEPAFLLGVSYYGALGAPAETLRRDLDEIARHGFHWLRVWATWAAFDNDVSAVDADGRPRDEPMKKLARLVAECDRRGLVVDVTLSRGDGGTGPARLQTAEAHRRAVESVVTALRPYRNWYLDLSNERNVKDKRFTSFDELKELCALVKKLDPDRLVTASHAGDVSRDELRDYLRVARVDFVCPHRPRDADSPARTEARTREYLGWTRELGREAPVHYQEPFRRGYGAYQPSAGDFAADLAGARAGGAAGWCFHNGDRRDRPDGRPRRCFDLRDGRLFDQLDDVEREALGKLR